MNAPISVSRLFLLAVISVVLVGAATATTASAKRFVTEDGNISCIMRSSFVRCDITKHRWQSPPKPKSCEFDYGSSLAITEKGKAEFACVSDATGATEKYGPGTTFETGPNVCRLRKQAKVFCQNKETGGGFNVAKKFYRLFP